MHYEEELMTIKRKSGVQEALRQRLSDSEVIQCKYFNINTFCWHEGLS